MRRHSVIAGVGLSSALGLLLAAITAAAPPSLTVAGTDAVVGGTIHATAQLSEGPSASGEISFEVFGPDDPSCLGPALTPAPASVTVAGEGEYSSGDFTPPEAGSYHWSAHYSGDLENEPADSACSAVSALSRAEPGLTGSASDAAVGSPIHDQVTVTGGFSPTGEVTFSVFGPADTACVTPLETESVPLVGGQASSADFVPQSTGAFRWTAAYSGDANNEAATLGCNAANQTSTVTKATPGLIGAATTSAVAGATITDSVTVSGGFQPGGNLVFRAFGPSDSTCSGATKYEATVPVDGNGVYSPAGFAPPAGVYRWMVSYSGDANNEAASLACNSANQTSTVTKATPGLAGTATSSVTVGATITDSVTVSGGFQPGGNLVFRAFGPSDSTCSGATKYEASVAVAGTGVYSPAGFAPPAGVYRWLVSYSGDANNQTATLGCNAANQTSTVTKATPGLVGTATTSAVAGSTITDSVTVSGGFQPGGNLVFRTFGPDDATCAGPATYEATVPVAGNGAYSPAGFSPPAGVYRWTVSYAGDASNDAASLACNAANQTSTVGKAAPGLAGVASSGVVGASITDSVTVSGGSEAGGDLLFRAFGPSDSSCAGPVKYESSVDVDGNGSYSPAGFSPAPGAYRWTVSYSGDANNEAASLPCNAANQTSTVSKATPGLAGAASSSVVVGATITDSVTVSGGFQAGGNLVFRAYGPSDATCAGATKYEATVPVAGNGAHSPAGFAPPAGVYRWTVSYSGDANNEAASLPCNAANQTSTVSKATPGLAGTATSAVTVGAPINDSVTVSGGFQAGGELVFRAFGPDDATCAGPATYEATVPVAGNGAYSPPGFVPDAGLYRWTVGYSGDANNETTALACNAPNQSSAVGTVAVTLTARVATNNSVGAPVTASASIGNGAIPKGKITFRAFLPSDANCTGTPAFSSTVNVNGNATYTSAPFTPSRVGTFRWAISYSGDANHAPAQTKCGAVTSSIAQARPTISSGVEGRGVVGSAFRVTATIRGGYAPTGTVTFQIFDQSKTVAGCARLLGINTVPVAGNGTVSSAPFVPRRPARYSFIAGYSGDAANQAATEGCDPTAHAAQVLKRAPKVKPRARLIAGKRISLRAQLSGAISPSGVVSFRLYRPGDTKCRRVPVFSGGVSVKANGRYLLARYVANRRGVYRLSVSYSGDQRNRRYSGVCSQAQRIRVG